MENFLNAVKKQRDIDCSNGAPSSEHSFEIPYMVRLMNLKKELDVRTKWIEEFIIDGNYEKAKSHLVWIGNETAKLYELTEILEKEDCKECIQNITKEELDDFLFSIGGLENGYAERYLGDSKIIKWLFNSTNRIIYKLPYYHKSKTFSKESTIAIFLYNICYWILKPILKDEKPRNPFRSLIFDSNFFEIGPGWYGLVKTLIEEAIKAGWNKEVCQVKEKFAGLRFYINGAPKEVHDIIHKYESLSYHICEECGNPGEQRGGAWLRTLCDTHQFN